MCFDHFLYKKIIPDLGGRDPRRRRATGGGREAGGHHLPHGGGLVLRNTVKEKTHSPFSPNILQNIQFPLQVSPV